MNQPRQATFVSSAAPNAGAAADNYPKEPAAIPDALHRRSEYVLALAAANGYKQLVLGAWGCGVFRNNSHKVAEAFASHLRRGAWAGRFERVIFSVLDTSPLQETFAAFQNALGQDAEPFSIKTEARQTFIVAPPGTSEQNP